ncbi:MAG: flagellar assembly protein FliH [Propionivibrio sp.]|uniref:flagellar assembly protein FliH n=1 Tax=Propionivibrio sp. TaxID=2212460 RepID=UPI001A5724D6|nr:flagellar assembly protein FliH [Propionivibrio sp.]MBL8413356.1 flagellar assembly protein FliH [Propionivibrio sp.]
MTGFVPKENLTAYQRWELAAFDEAEQAAAHKSHSASIPTSAGCPTEHADRDEPTSLALPTAADIERMHIDAHQQGYTAGHAEGIAEARASAARIDAVMTSLQLALSELDQQVADQLLATAVEIASQMLRQSLRVKPELLLPVVREAVATLHPHLGHPALFAHPDDAALIRTHLGDQLTQNNWRIIEDATLSSGGCRVELGASEVDATLETRWRRVIESIGISQEWLSDKP